MDIVIAGGHGRVAMLLHPLLVGRGHKVRGLIRDPGQAGDLAAVGAEPVLCDLELMGDIAEPVGPAHAVIFAAGAGPGSDAARKRAMDRDGAIKLMAAAKANGIRRFLMISTFHADQPRGSEIFQAYMRAKAEADAALRESGLDYTIIRPGRLTDAPGTGGIELAPRLKGADVPRADVAALLAACLDDTRAMGRQWEVTGGNTPIADAIAQAIDQAGA
ncbi:MAG: SDR family oxidoreductase [Alphaproteobacteria bacterium]|nr:MAG: SDR family oxidoreductase [Alphaproteobacteria bacterium]